MFIIEYSDDIYVNNRNIIIIKKEKKKRVLTVLSEVTCDECHR